MTCKDCIHYEACNAMGRTVEFAVDGGVCKEFEDKSLYIKLPCKVGDTVYEIREYYDCRQDVYLTCDAFNDDEANCFGCPYHNIVRYVTDKTYECPKLETVFLTREEAEAALEGRK